MAYNKSFGKAVRSAGKSDSRKNSEDKKNSPITKFDWKSTLDRGQDVLTGAGMTPFFGNFVDGLNVAISGGRAAYAKYTGDEDEYRHHRNSAAINAAAMIPGAGIAVGAGKLAKTGLNLAKGSNTASKSTKVLKAIGKTAVGFADSQVTSKGVDIADKLTSKPKKEQIAKLNVKSKSNFA